MSYSRHTVDKYLFQLYSKVTCVICYLSSGGHPTVPAKVQELAESLQQISGQLNTVLGALGSIAQRQSPTSYTAFTLPPSQPHPTPAPTSTTFTSAPILPHIHTHSSTSLPTPFAAPWNWAPQSSSSAPPLFSTPITSGLWTSEDPVSSRWNQIFPGTPTAELFCSTCFISGIIVVGPELLLCSPGAAMDPLSSSTMRPASSYSSYIPAR